MALAKYGDAINIDTDVEGNPILVDAVSGDTIATYDRAQSAWVYGDTIHDSVSTEDLESNRASLDARSIPDFGADDIGDPLLTYGAGGEGRTYRISHDDYDFGTLDGNKLSIAVRPSTDLMMAHIKFTVLGNDASWTGSGRYRGLYGLSTWGTRNGENLGLTVDTLHERQMGDPPVDQYYAGDYGPGYPARTNVLEFEFSFSTNVWAVYLDSMMDQEGNYIDVIDVQEGEVSEP